VATREALHQLIDGLPDESLDEAARRLSPPYPDPVLRAALLAPINDEPLTDEDIAAIEEGRQQIARGEFVTNEEVMALLERAGR
jgi:predicted transcriptional regulator